MKKLAMKEEYYTYPPFLLKDIKGYINSLNTDHKFLDCWAEELRDDLNVCELDGTLSPSKVAELRDLFFFS